MAFINLLCVYDKENPVLTLSIGEVSKKTALSKFFRRVGQSVPKKRSSLSNKSRNVLFRDEVISSSSPVVKSSSKMNRAGFHDFSI